VEGCESRLSSRRAWYRSTPEHSSAAGGASFRRVDVTASGGGIVHTSGERKRRQDGDIDVTNGSSCYAEREVREGGAR